jgi:DNA-binding MurR/RpiR family transcriptional regulator
MAKTATRSRTGAAKARSRNGKHATKTVKPSNGKRSTAKAKANIKSLSDFITERFDEFSRSQKDVARYIVDHLDEAAFQTAEELARRAETSSSTVVRFSQALGFEGYPELQQAAIEEYRRRDAEGNGGNAALFDFDHSEFEASLAADHANVEDTARSLTREQVEACVSALANSRRVVIVGMEQMAFFASYLRHLLALLDIRTEVVSSPRQDAIGRLGRVEDDTLVVAFSAGRAHPLVVRAMKLARHRGARTLSISDATLSDVGEHAELTLYYSSNSPSYSRSNAALLSVVQALAYGVYARDKAAYKDRIRAFKLK